MGSQSSETEFEYDIDAADASLSIRLRGWMGYETLELQKACWTSVGGQIKPEIVLDMAEVTCLASAALGCILALRRALEEKGCWLRISAASLEVREIVRVMRLGMLFSTDRGPRLTAV
jgi:anti-anti-sigma factor